jgi:prevent-host-death family protein
MTTVTTDEAKTNLPKLLALVEAGEEVVIARSGKPIARLIPADPPRREIRLGMARDLAAQLPPFRKEMTEEELAAWYDPSSLTSNDGELPA